MLDVIARANTRPVGRAADRRRSPRATTRGGAALVEMAIVIPVLLLLTLGLIEYGWVFYKVSQLNQAARHGVRTAVRPDATTDNVISGPET